MIPACDRSPVRDVRKVQESRTFYEAATLIAGNSSPGSVSEGVAYLCQQLKVFAAEDAGRISVVGAPAYLGIIQQDIAFAVVGGEVHVLNPLILGKPDLVDTAAWNTLVRSRRATVLDSREKAIQWACVIEHIAEQYLEPLGCGRGEMVDLEAVGPNWIARFPQRVVSDDSGFQIARNGTLTNQPNLPPRRSSP